jgi:DNA-binding NarL/FixJ family response regulator
MTGRVTLSLPVIAVAARECDVPGCPWRGLSNTGIASQLGIRAKRIGSHVERIYRSPGVEPGRRCDARHVARLVRSTAAPVD